MKLKLPLLLLILLGFFQPVLAATPVNQIRNYIQNTYGDKLIISDEQIEQLSWILDSPVMMPELERKGSPHSIHREVPRALSRLYSLQLLKSGKDKDYQRFIEPQIDDERPKLNKDSFTALSKRISTLDDESYEVLQATAIISGVTLSVKARARAEAVLLGEDLSEREQSEKIPEDSNQFLSMTAPQADKIYPLAEKLIKQYPDAKRKIEIIFLPNSHLRHMMYNEGSLDMYSTIKTRTGDGRLTQKDLDLWYDHWVINIAGFRGHLTSLGSLYLGQRTYMAMNQVKLALDKMVKDRKINPMALYLKKRSNWLSLSSLTKSPQEQMALASMAASLRLFTVQEGKVLFKSFRQLSASDQRRWLTYVERQLVVQNRPTPTYAPALLANAVDVSGLSVAIIKVIPIILDSFELAHKLRLASVMKADMPLSFWKMAEEPMVSRILKGSKPLVVGINTDNGSAYLK